MILSVVSSLKGGGAELLVRELHKLYLNKGFDSHAIFFSGNPTDLGPKERVMGVYPRNPFNIFRIRKLLKFYLAKSDNNLTVHVHLTWPFVYVALASFGLRNIILIYTEHSTSNKRRKIPFLWFFERFLYSRYSKIICISQGVCKSLEVWVGPSLKSLLVTIPNGSRIYSLADRPSLLNRKPSLISVGSLTAKKNFSTALRAVSQIKDEIESYSIIGEGPERASLEKIIQEEQLQGKVKLIGWSDAIEPHLHRADIQLIPSLWEGFGLVAVEGMSTGIAVVASNVDGLREVLDESNVAVTLVDGFESVDEWVSAIHYAIHNLHLSGQVVISEASRRQAEQFTLERMAESYLEVYREV